MIIVCEGELGHDESLSEQVILGRGICVPDENDEHQGWVSTSFTMIQVSNVVCPNTKGKVQLPQPLGVGGYVGGAVVAVHIARNPVYGMIS